MNAKSILKVLSITAVFTLAAIPSFAATNGTLVISGVVAPVMAIVVTPDANASALPVGTAVSGMAIASVNELSNNKAGYTVTLSSSNEGVLKGATVADELPYTLNYNGAGVTFVSGSAVISDVSTRTPAAGTTCSLNISFAAAFLEADTYSDTLTFTIAAK